MMRIAYDHQIFGWQRYGGISRYFFELATNIAQAKTDEVAIISPLYVNAYLSSAPDDLRILGRKVPAVKRSGRIYRAINQFLAPPLLKSFRPDVVHESYYSMRGLAPTTSKVVLTVFDMIHERFPESFPPWDSTAKEKAAAVQRADHVICISENTRQDLIQILGVRPEKTSVVHLGFTLTATAGTAPPARTRPFLLYVGKRDGYKNFDRLLQVYGEQSALRNEFDLVAFGGGAFSLQERSLMDRFGLSASQVQQIGGDDSVLADLYRTAHLFVYPSLYEGFGIPPLEAMSFDCPVVCSNSSSIPEVVGDAAVFFDPDSGESMGQALMKVASDVSLRQALVARGRERIKMFSWQRCAKQTIDVYRSVLA
jgi:glycosyltransferase involved in cell wall biosynthesis